MRHSALQFATLHGVVAPSHQATEQQQQQQQRIQQEPCEGSGEQSRRIQPDPAVAADAEEGLSAGAGAGAEGEVGVGAAESGDDTRYPTPNGTVPSFTRPRLQQQVHMSTRTRLESSIKSAMVKPP